MFGAPRVNFFGAPGTGAMGDQIRGFGFVNDGSVDPLFRFFTAVVFNPQLNAGFPILNPDATRRDVVQFMLAFDSDLAPIVGQQVTPTKANASTVHPRINLLIQRAKANFVSKELRGAIRECDLMAKVGTRRQREGLSAGCGGWRLRRRRQYPPHRRFVAGTGRHDRTEGDIYLCPTGLRPDVTGK